MKVSKFIKKFEKKLVNNPNPILNVGDRVRIGTLIKEAEKKRVQFFEGIIISKHQLSNNIIITVRRIFQGVGVERTFPLSSPQIKSIELLSHSKVKRAKLFYLRSRIGKAASMV